MLLNFILVLTAYLAGSVSSAILICRVLGLADPRQGGSRNPGATNVLRMHGKKIAGLTLVGDVLKGAIPIWFVSFLKAPDYVVALCACGAVLGHVYPVFFRFQGGKGIATLIGVLTAIHLLMVLGYLITWGLAAKFSGYSSVGGITATLLLPIYSTLIFGEPIFIFMTAALSILVVYRHKVNIRNLLRGTEPKLKSRSGEL